MCWRECAGSLFAQQVAVDESVLAVTAALGTQSTCFPGTKAQMLTAVFVQTVLCANVCTTAQILTQTDACILTHTDGCCGLTDGCILTHTDGCCGLTDGCILMDTDGCCGLDTAEAPNVVVMFVRLGADWEQGPHFTFFTGTKV
jgi:hypothetical protein